MVRNNSSAEAKNSLLQLSNWGQVSNSDRDGVESGADSAASDESGHAAAQSIITQVKQSTWGLPHAATTDEILSPLCMRIWRARTSSEQRQISWTLYVSLCLIRNVDRVQVNSRSDKPAVASEYSKDDAPEPSTSWRDRLRAFFCCFAPDANEQYYRSSKAEAAVIRPPQPPTPPAYRGEPVIGPLQVITHASLSLCTCTIRVRSGCVHVLP